MLRDRRRRGGNALGPRRGRRRLRGRAVVRADPAQERARAAAAGAGATRTRSRTAAPTSARCRRSACRTRTDSRRCSRGRRGDENIPLMPVFSPLTQYTNLFSNFVPADGGRRRGRRRQPEATARAAASPVADAMLKKLVRRRSVLDFAHRGDEPAQADGPHGGAEQAADPHRRHRRHGDRRRRTPSTGMPIAARRRAAAPRRAAAAGGANGGPRGGGTCATQPPAPPAASTGMADPTGGDGNCYGDPTAKHGRRGQPRAGRASSPRRAEGGVRLRLIRVGTFQWSPGTNHVGFAPVPGDDALYQHHPPATGSAPATPPRPHACGVDGPRSSSTTCRSGISRATPRTSRLEEHGRRLRQQPARLHGRPVRDRGARDRPRAQRHARDDHRRQVAGLRSQPVLTAKSADQRVLGDNRPGVRLHVDRRAVRRANRRLLGEPAGLKARNARSTR